MFLFSSRPGDGSSEMNPGGLKSTAKKNGSGIPVSSGTNGALKDTDALRQQVLDLKAQNRHLQNTLKATEETVHCQTQKMKYYRNMLVENGLLSMSRSQSVPDIFNLRSSVSPPADGSEQVNRRQSDSLQESTSAARFRSFSPLGRNRSSSVDCGDFTKLNKEIRKLKQQVDSYRKVLQVFQHSRSPSPNSDSDKSGLDVDGAPEPMSAAGATCLVENWLDLLDKFLTDFNEPGHMDLPVSSVELSRLRRGLAQVRTAVDSLSKASQGR